MLLIMSIFRTVFTCPAAPSDPGVIFSSQSQYYLYGEYCRSAVLLERVGCPPGWASSCWRSVFMSWECSRARHAVLPSAACREREGWYPAVVCRIFWGVSHLFGMGCVTFLRCWLLSTDEGGILPQGWYSDGLILKVRIIPSQLKAVQFVDVGLNILLWDLP